MISAKKARKVTGLPNKRLEKSSCSVMIISSWSGGTPAACGNGASPAIDLACVRSTPTLFFGRVGKRIVKPYSEREDFWQFYSLYRHQHRTVWPLFLVVFNCFQFRDFSFPLVSGADFIIRRVTASTVGFEQQRCTRYTYVRHRKLSSAVSLGNGQRHAHSGYT